MSESRFRDLQVQPGQKGIQVADPVQLDTSYIKSSSISWTVMGFAADSSSSSPPLNKLSYDRAAFSAARVFASPSSVFFLLGSRRPALGRLHLYSIQSFLLVVDFALVLRLVQPINDGIFALRHMDSLDLLVIVECHLANSHIPRFLQVIPRRIDDRDIWLLVPLN